MFAQLQASLANASAAARAAVTGAANANAQADVKTANATKMMFEAERLELERQAKATAAQRVGRHRKSLKSGATPAAAVEQEPQHGYGTREGEQHHGYGTLGHIQLIETNPTTAVREVSSGDGDTSDAQSDGHLESKMIKPSKRVLCGVSKKQAVARGRELNAVMGTRTTLEDNVGGQTPEREREHRAILKHQGLKVMLARAAMRKLVFPAIRRQLEQPLQLLAATVDDDFSATSAVPVLVPRIPVRSQEGTAETRTPNPDFKNSQAVAEARVTAAGKWALRADIGGQYEVSGVLLNFPVVSYYNKAMKQALAYVVKRGDRAMEVIAVLSGDAGAAAALNRPCCLVNLSRSCGVSRI